MRRFFSIISFEFVQKKGGDSSSAPTALSACDILCFLKRSENGCLTKKKQVNKNMKIGKRLLCHFECVVSSLSFQLCRLFSIFISLFTCISHNSLFFISFQKAQDTARA